MYNPCVCPQVDRLRQILDRFHHSLNALYQSLALILQHLNDDVASGDKRKYIVADVDDVFLRPAANNPQQHLKTSTVR